jgi:hypothetical protein
MSLKYKIIAYLDRTPDFRDEVKLQNDGSGDYIAEWNPKDKSKPSDSQLNALASEATKLENNNKIRYTRKQSYGNIGDQLDEIYKDIDAWKARIKKIKDDNPKE